MTNRLMDSMRMFGGKLFDAAVMFIFNIVAVRVVGIEDYGTYVYISSAVMLVSILIKLGLDQGITVLSAKKEKREDIAVIITTGVMLLYVLVVGMVIVITLTSGYLAEHVLNTADYVDSLRLYVPILMILPFTQVAEGIFRSVYRISDFVVGKNILMPIMLTVSFFIFYYLMGINGLQALFLCNYVGFGSGAIYMVYRMIKEGLLAFDPSKFIEVGTSLVKVSVPLIFLGMHEYLIGRTDAFVIGYFMDESYVGVFNISDKLAYISSFVFVAIGSVIAPEISKYFHLKKNLELSDMFRESTRFLVIINTLVFFGIWVISDWFMGMATDNMHDGAAVLVVLSFAYLIHSLFGPVAYLNAMTSGERSEFNIGMGMLVGNVVLNVVFLNTLGLIGISISTCIVFLAGDLYRSAKLRQSLGIRFDYGNFRIVLVGVLAFVTVRVLGSMVFEEGLFIGALIQGVFLVMGYGLTVYFKVLTVDEKKMWKRFGYSMGGNSD